METNNSPFVFIRDDDVWRLDESFLRFFRYCLNSKIPVVYAVIPAKATKELLNFLAEQKKRNPNLLDIVQHGWNHQNHNKYAPSKYEFGKNRSFAQQKEDIVNGLLKLYIHFGDAFTPAFVPPYHGFNSDTLEILKQFNFPVFFNLPAFRLFHKSLCRHITR